MITSVEVENFRGIERLSVTGLGRVNLVIGKNNSGKTALMEAVGVATFAESAGEQLGSEQLHRMPDANIGDFDRVWRPLFRSEDAERGFSLRATREPGGPLQFLMRKARGERIIAGGLAANPSAPLRSSAWVLECELKAPGKSERFQISRQPDASVAFPPAAHDENSFWWIAAGTPDLTNLIGALSDLKQEGRDGQVRDLLRHLDERIESLEILSPRGTDASLFVRIAGEPKLLPFEMMGEGVQRCFDLALGFVLDNVMLIAVDEFENGLHHSVLEPVWTWLAHVSASRNVQVVATTHSEECVQAACRAFSALNDDGLRVIRLERQPHQTAATVYDRNLVEAAGRMGVELRG
jgi:hypothetical protein